jgi:hypothetical protein
MPVSRKNMQNGMQTVALMANEMSNLDEQANEKEENQDQLILVNNRCK